MDYLHFIVNEIHTVVAATTDDKGLPVTCAIDMMDSDKNGLYFLTAKGKGFYSRLKKNGYMALTGMKGKDTMSCVAVSVRGKVCELGTELLPRLFEKNPYIKEIYPTKESQQALTVFRIPLIIVPNPATSSPPTRISRKSAIQAHCLYAK